MRTSLTQRWCLQRCAHDAFATAILQWCPATQNTDTCWKPRITSSPVIDLAACLPTATHVLYTTGLKNLHAGSG